MARTGAWVVAGAVLASATTALARDGVVAQLRALAPEARAVWPGLAAGVDDAAALRRELGPGPFDGPALFAARYGRDGVSRRETEADRRLLADALEALVVMERAAAARGEETLGLRATHDQLLARLQEGLRQARRAANLGPGPERVESVHAQPRPYADQLAALPQDDPSRLGLAPVVLLLLASLAGDDEAAGEDAALGPARVRETLALGGLCQTYALAGRGERSGPYAGSALLLRRAGALRLIRLVDGQPAMTSDLARRGDAWGFVARARAQGGLATALAGEARQDVAFEADYAAVAHPAGDDDARLDGRWRVTTRDGGELDAGQETLTHEGPELGLTAQLRLSDLMAAIVAASTRHASSGNVPADLMLTSGNAASPRPLLTGPEIFPAMAELIAGAEHEVLVQFFVWETGSQAAATLCEALRELERRRAARPEAPPVRVRFVLNAHPVAAGGRAGWRAFEAQLRGLRLDPRRVDLRLGRYRHLLLGGLHAKALLVDGRRAILTGANVETCHDAGQPWFDAGFAVEGPVGRALRAEYDQLWHQATGEHLPPLEADLAPAGAATILVAGRRAEGSPFANGVEDPQGAAFVAAITHAKRLVRIQTPNLNDDDIQAALVHALVKNGVRVELIVPYGFNDRSESLPGRGGTNLDTITALRERVRRADPAALERFDVRWYANPHGELVVGNGPWASHCKYATFDGHVAIVGSGNLDTQAINNSRELNVVVDDAVAVGGWDARLFEPNLARAIPVRAVSQQP